MHFLFSGFFVRLLHCAEFPLTYARCASTAGAWVGPALSPPGLVPSSNLPQRNDSQMVREVPGYLGGRAQFTAGHGCGGRLLTGLVEYSIYDYGYGPSSKMAQNRTSRTTKIGWHELPCLHIHPP